MTFLWVRNDTLRGRIAIFAICKIEGFFVEFTFVEKDVYGMDVKS